MVGFFSNDDQRNRTQRAGVTHKFFANLHLIIFLLLLIFFNTFRAQNITVSASTDTNSYKVGDYIKFQLELRYDKNVKTEMPPVKDSIKVLEFIQALPVDSSEENSKIIKRYNYFFSRYDSSQVTIPPLKIFYTVGSDTTKKFLASNPITITVKTLKVNSREDIRDVKEPMNLPLNWLLIALASFVVLALLVAAYFLYRYYKKKKAIKENVQPEVKIPPHEIALAKLSELEQKKLWQNGLVKQYHSEVTGIVRQYFEDRFSFRALEMTSAEILAVLDYLEEGKKIVETSNNFFSNADLVKFAKFLPMPDVNEEMMKQAYKIVNQTILPAELAGAELQPQSVSE
ncbi:MAG: hypothetical protein AB1298_08520 [Bacteroidota bacterium]